MLDGYKEQEWMAFDHTRLDAIDSHFDEEFGNKVASDDSDSERVEHFYCIACDKMFKSGKALTNHEKSKKHKENVELIKNEMEADLLEDLHIDSLNVQDQQFERLSSLNLPANVVKVNLVEKNVISNGNKFYEKDSSKQDAVHHSTDSLKLTKIKGTSSREGSIKIKEKKKKGKQGKDEDEESWTARHTTHENLLPKDSLALPRKKSKKQEVRDSADRLRANVIPDDDGLISASLCGNQLADSIRINKKQSKADRKKGRRKLLNKNKDSSIDIEDEEEEEEEEHILACDAENRYYKKDAQNTHPQLKRSDVQYSTIHQENLLSKGDGWLQGGFEKNEKKECNNIDGDNIFDANEDLDDNMLNDGDNKLNVGDSGLNDGDNKLNYGGNKLNDGDNMLNDGDNGLNDGDGETIDDSLEPVLKRTVVADSIRYNRNKMEHHGKHLIQYKKILKENEIAEGDEFLEVDNEKYDEIEENNQESHNSVKRNKKKEKKMKNRQESSDLFKCGVCGKDYPTRNKLFDHIKTEGHAITKLHTGKGKGKKM